MTSTRDALNRRLLEETTRVEGPSAWSQPLNDDEWDLLVDAGTIAHFERGQTTLESIGNHILTWRRASNPRPRARRRRGPSEQHRRDRGRRSAVEDALADMCCWHLEGAPLDRWGVRAFWAEILHDQPVAGLRAWIDQEVQRQGSPTVAHGRVNLVAVRVGDTTIRRATTHGGTLERLRHLSEGLADFYGWDPADAATYVLTITRRSPPIQTIRGDVQLKWPVPARAKIVLTIDPTATPSEVADAYSRLRTYQFGRVRRLDAKHATLAAFAYRHAGLPPAEQMALWNRTHREGRYQYVSVFKREAALAFASLAEWQPQRAARQGPSA